MAFEALARVMLTDYQCDLLRWIPIFTRIEGGLGDWHPLTDALARVLTAGHIKGELPIGETMETLTYAFNVIEEYRERWAEYELIALSKQFGKVAAA